jgi:hypothetical protein
MYQHDITYTQELEHYNTILPVIHEIMPDSVHMCVKNIASYLEPVVQIFSPLTPSTLTAQGELSNVYFHEMDLIEMVAPSGSIKKITCNYGDRVSDTYKPPVVKEKTTNRGRKPKVKKKNVRKNQGNGKYFNSQITFWVESRTIEGKYYKTKVFRNGTTEIPGGLDPKMQDVQYAMDVVRGAMQECLLDDVKIVELYSIMRNYKFHLIDETVRINVTVLCDEFIKAKSNNETIAKNLTEIKYNIERYPGLIAKFSTPTVRRPNKQTTIKMFKSGKTNIDGAISEESAAYYYKWINAFYDKHKDAIMYVPREDVDSSSDDECEEKED